MARSHESGVAPGMRDRAQTVIIGAGVVGVSAAYHLTELGVTDVLVLEQGSLFETGGSTSHAPGIIFQTNGSRTMCRIAQDTVELYGSLDLDGEQVWYGTGSLEVATSPDRMQELKRRQGYARAYGLDGTELLTPTEAAERSPLLEPASILGAYWVPSDGAAKGVRVVEALARKAGAAGVAFEGGVTVTGFDVRDGRVHGVETDRGTVGCERVLLCAGIWGPTVGALAGRPGPARRGPASARVDRPDPRARCVRRRHLVAAAGRAPSGHVAVLPSARGSLRRRQLPARADRDAPGGDPASRRLDAAVAHAVHARRLRSRARRRPRACSPRSPGACARRDPTRSLNGMFSFTPDAGSIVGESATVRGFWVCEAVWVTHAGGMARQAVEWMVEGDSELRPRRGRREPLLPVPDDRLPTCSSVAGSSTARSTTSSIRCSSRRTARAEAHAVRGAAPSSSARSSSRGRGGSGRNGSPRTASSSRGRHPRVGAAHRVGRAGLVAGGRCGTPRHARARGADRHHAVREVRRDRPRRARRTWSECSPTGSTGRWARSCTRRR